MITQQDLDKLATAIDQMGNAVKDQVDEVKGGLRTESESRKEYAKRLEDIEKSILELRKKLPDDSVLTDRQGESASRPGGIFAKGEPLLPYDEVISMAPKNSTVRGTDADLLFDLQQANDCVALQLACRTARYGGDRAAAINETTKTRDWQRWNRVRKAAGYKEIVAKDTMMYPEGGYGANLTTTVLSAQVLEPVRLSLRVANQFATLPLVAASQKFPANRGDGLGVRGGAGTTDPPPRADITTPWGSAAHFTSVQFGQVQFDVKDILAFMWYSDHMLQDSFIPYLPYINNQIGFCVARARDRACMSGDIQGTSQGAHMDDWNDDFTVQDARTLWNGMRRLAANYAAGPSPAATYGYDDFKVQTKALGKFALDRENVVLWLPVGAYYDFMADGAFLKVNEFGPDAVIRTGAIGSCEGVQVVITEWIPTDESASGYSVTAGVLTEGVMANVSRFMLGTLGSVSIELTRVAPMLANIIQASTREDFVPLEAIDGSKIFAASQTVPVNRRINLTR